MPNDPPKHAKSGHAGGAASKPQRTGAPAKGDSTPSEPPIDPGSGATFSDASPLTLDGSTPIGDANATLSDGPATPPSGRNFSGIFVKDDVLQPGDILGGRYEILQLLGEGGMGSVYKAKDREIERFVALKLIRPDLASNPAILARFKQELMTAHQVTHKNVIRIYDLAEAANIKFITMEYVEGSDLRRILLDNGKVPPEKAVQIIRQVCLALDAAHSAGVIHRDLKPQNIMQDKNGRILVMDFGLARSLVADGMTQTGVLLGTIEYMSPEQAMGKELDGRSDIFAVGLILYELLTGKMPYRAETAMASLLKRNQERAIPVAELEPSIPKGLSDIVSKCLERDLTLRYQSAQEILTDLDAWQGNRPTIASLSTPIPAQAPRRVLPWKWIAASALALAVAAGGWMLRGRGATTATKGTGAPQVSLAILPFHNATTDLSMDWIGPSLADMLSTDVGQSSRMHTVSTDRLHQILKDLRIAPNAVLDTDMLRRIAELSNADTVVWGQYAKYGEQIRIDATLLDLKRDRRAPLRIEAASEKEIPRTVDGLADLIRKNLSVSSDVMKELRSSSFQPTSKSVPALRDYNRGVQLFRDGKNLEAVKALEAASQEDPEFALAYSRLAEVNSALGYDSDAERYSRRAVDLSQSLPLAEKYLVEANHARMIKDNKKAVVAYENLSKTFPDNSDVQYILGGLYADKGDYDKARALFTRILEADPKNIKALWQMGVVEIMRDKPQAALDPLNKGLSLAIQVDNQEQKALILQAIGISYRLMNKPDEAMRNYADAMAINRKLGLQRNLANNLSEMAQVQSASGKPDAALGSYSQALDILRGIGMKKDYGDTLINRGVVYESRSQYDKALQDYKEALQIQRDAQDENYQALCLSNIGGVYLAKGDTDNALTYLQQSLQLRQKLNDTEYVATTLSALGEVYGATGEYEKALTSFMSALDISRKSSNARVAALQSAQIGAVLRYQGRLGAAIGAMQDAVDGYRAIDNRSREMVEALNGLAGTLAEAGRGGESAKLLAEAQGLARDLKNETVEADLLNTQGDVAFHRGDWKTAKAVYGQALRAASHNKDRNRAFALRVNLARVAIAEGRAQSAVSDLRATLKGEAGLNLPYVSLKASVTLAEALISSKDYAGARKELERSLGRSEKLGLRFEAAKIHYFLANTLRLSGNSAESAGHYRQAMNMLDEIKKEPGAEHLLERPDLRALYADAQHWTGAAKS